MTFYFRRASVGLLLLSAASLLLGCNADIRTYCEDLTDCAGLTSADEDACIADLKGDRDVADEYGCRDEFDDLFACIAEYGRCEYNSSGGAYYTTGEDEDGTARCEAEEELYDDCGWMESNW